MLFPDAPPEEMHKNFQYLTTCYHIWPREWMGVTLLRGAEADIVDLSGNLYGYDIPISHMIVGDPYREGERSLRQDVQWHGLFDCLCTRKVFHDGRHKSTNDGYVY